jgi:cystathionine beta-lyase/cystathionine gamma-synthase
MSRSPDARGFGTRAIAAAMRPPEVRQAPSAVPIYQSATFAAEDAEELADILAFRRPGYSYARIENPTASALAEAFAELHGAEAGFAFGSGMAAVHAALVSLVRAGDRIVSTRSVYGSTRTLMTRVLGGLGVATDLVDASDADAVARALEAPTRVLYLETIANPTLEVADLAVLAALGHDRGAVVVVDNTFASPYLCRPIELGADLVLESCTKWIGGHSDVICGAVAGTRRLIEAVRDTAVETGGIAAPFSAFLALRGLQTLHVRMDRHTRNALALAHALAGHPRVRAVVHPGLASHPQASVAGRQLRSGGGLLTLDLGARDVAARFIDALRIPPRTASLGSTFTLAVHPPSNTHRQMSDEELAAAGIGPGLVRVSVGLEDADDLVADFLAALEAAAGDPSSWSATTTSAEPAWAGSDPSSIPVTPSA